MPLCHDHIINTHLIVVGQVHLWSHQRNLQLIVDETARERGGGGAGTSRVQPPSVQVEITIAPHLFLILVLTRGASNRGLVPTSRTTSAA